jgi:dihydroxy-acid dehydratase
LLVPEEELARRRAGWQPRSLAVSRGFLGLYSKIVTQANQGAILKA